MSKGINVAARSVSRQLLMQALYQWQINQTQIDNLFEQFRNDKDYAKSDKDYFESTLQVILKTNDEVDELLAPALDRPLVQLDPIARGILWVSTYELQHRIEIPYRVVINEGVKLAKKFGAADAHKYINAVLDKLAVNLRSVEKEISKTQSKSRAKSKSKSKSDPK